MTKRTFLTDSHLVSLAVAGVVATAGYVSGQVIDGSTEGDGYGEPLAIQTNGTGFGDNFSELNAAYGKIVGDDLLLVLTGNLEGNFNKLEIFLDSIPGGQNVIESASNAANDGWASRFDGFGFDTGFEADFLVFVRNGNTGGNRVLDIDYNVIGQMVGSRVGRFTLTNPVSRQGPFTSDNGIVVGFDNTNTGGVTSGFADPVEAAAVTTGIELSIPLALLGDPEGDIRVCAMVNGSSHDFLSNQFLGGLELGIPNLGNDGAGGLSHIDLSFELGDQFFTVPNTGGGGDPATVSSVESGIDFLTITLTDTPSSTVQTGSIALLVGGVDVTTSSDIAKDEASGVTTVSYLPAPRFAPDTVFSYAVSAEDQSGTGIGRSGEFQTPRAFNPGPFPPVPPGGDGFWGIRQAWFVEDYTDGTIDGLDDALAAANAVPVPGFTGESFDGQTAFLNFGSGGIFPGGLEYPAFDAGLTEDQFVSIASALVRIPMAGDWTFGIHSDDGCALQVVGVEFDSVHGAGRLDTVDPSYIGHPENTGDSNTRGIVRGLEAGDYRFNFIVWDASGGDFFELYAAPGAHQNDTDTQEWALLGFQPPAPTVAVPGVTEAGWSVKTAPPGSNSPDGLRTIFDAIDALAPETETTVHDVINFSDPESDGTNSGNFGDDIPFPRNTPDDDNDYAIEAEATLVIPRDGTYHIGFRGDDGSTLQIDGQTFDEIVDDATGGAVGEGTDTLECDCLTGNNQTVGKLDLAMGSYTIRVIMFEAENGSYFEVFGAEAGAARPFLIERNGARVVEAPPGLRLVAEGAGSDDGFQITSITVADGQVTLRWPSEAGQTFTVESTTGFSTWAAAAADIPGGTPATEFTEPVPDPAPDVIGYRVIRH